MNSRGQIQGILVSLVIIAVLLTILLGIIILSPQVLEPKKTIVYNSPKQQYCETIKIPYVEYETEPAYSVTYYGEMRYKSESYTQKAEGVFNDYDKYVVEIKNQEKIGGYFEVKFRFRDEDGDRVTKVIRKYLRPSETETFVYRDINDHFRYYGWTYSVETEPNNHYEFRQVPVTKYRTEVKCYWI